MRINSILLVGSGAESSLEMMYLRSFKSLGCARVDLFDTDLILKGWRNHKLAKRFLQGYNYARISSNLIAHLEQVKGCYELIIVFKGMQFGRESLNKCRTLSRQSVWTNINPDDPLNNISRGATNRNVLSCLDFYDLYCTWSRQLEIKLSSDYCKQVVYLPFGYDEWVHRIPETIVSGESRLVTFVGSWDPEREKVLTKIAALSASNDFVLKIFGNGWQRVSKYSPLKKSLVLRPLAGAELNEITNRSTINLNLLRPQNAGSHNMRTFEIPAMGGLMLTNNTVEQQEYFPDGEACYMYSNHADLEEKIIEILNNPSSALHVCESAAKLVLPHSYTSRAEYLLSEVSKIQ